MPLHPAPEYNNSAITAFHVPNAADTAQWTASDDPAVNEHLCIFLRTGGDGSWAGLWLDDQGQQRIVHLGSGSGSTMLCVLTQSVEDLIRLLAIGYNEHCWPEEFTQTPSHLRDQQYADNDYPAPPKALRDFVERTLGLGIPARASELVPSTTSMDANESSDPFWNWLKRIRND
ncbi:hypothetical protein [Pseudomonas sp. SDO5271_S396]